MDRYELGKKGEQEAARFLKNKNYSILETNHHKRSGEIDIIATDPKHDEYVFIEVKTRQNTAFQRPEAALSERKIEKITETAHCWMSSNTDLTKNWRIDLISIEWSDQGPLVEHFENLS